MSTDSEDGMDAVDKVIGIERADWVYGGLSNVEQFVKLQILNSTMQLNRISIYKINAECLVREGCGKSKWKFLMAFAIRGPTPPP